MRKTDSDRIRPTKMLHFKRGAGQCGDHENGFARTLPAVCDIEQTTESARNEMSNANINSVTLIAINYIGGLIANLLNAVTEWQHCVLNVVSISKVGMTCFLAYLNLV